VSLMMKAGVVGTGATLESAARTANRRATGR
jgi:hypothetical protein